MSESNNTPVTIAAVVGSLRKDSFNRAVFNAARDLMPHGVTLVEAAIVDVPLFSQDIEEAGDPDSVTTLKEAVSAADALVIFTPEYNRSIPGVTKNVVDWLSRPFFAGPIAAKPVGIVAASPGGGDAAGCRGHLAQAAAGAAGNVYEASLGIASVANALTDGDLADEEVRAAIADWAVGFVSFVREGSAA